MSYKLSCFKCYREPVSHSMQTYLATASKFFLLLSAIFTMASGEVLISQEPIFGYLKARKELLLRDAQMSFSSNMQLSENEKSWKTIFKPFVIISGTTSLSPTFSLLLEISQKRRLLLRILCCSGF